VSLEGLESVKAGRGVLLVAKPMVLISEHRPRSGVIWPSIRTREGEEH
jgi:hypothetical protein